MVDSGALAADVGVEMGGGPTLTWPQSYQAKVGGARERDTPPQRPRGVSAHRGTNTRDVHFISALLGSCGVPQTGSLASDSPPFHPHPQPPEVLDLLQCPGEQTGWLDSGTVVETSDQSSCLPWRAQVFCARQQEERGL